VKIHKLGKKKFLLVNWDEPYFFVGYKDGKGIQEYDNVVRIAFQRQKKNKFGRGLNKISKVYHHIVR
jgi:hypothetical protein